MESLDLKATIIKMENLIVDFNMIVGLVNWFTDL